MAALLRTSGAICVFQFVHHYVFLVGPTKKTSPSVPNVILTPTTKRRRANLSAIPTVIQLGDFLPQFPRQRPRTKTNPRQQLN